jgi:hypothetical protein
MKLLGYRCVLSNDEEEKGMQLFVIENNEIHKLLILCSETVRGIIPPGTNDISKEWS